MKDLCVSKMRPYFPQQIVFTTKTIIFFISFFGCFQLNSSLTQILLNLLFICIDFEFKVFREITAKTLFKAFYCLIQNKTNSRNSPQKR